MKRLTVFLALLMPFFGCAHYSGGGRPEGAGIALQEVESLKIGEARENDVKTRFGAPHQMAKLNGQGVMWFYLAGDKTFDQVSLLFSPHGLLAEKNWIMSGNEPEHAVPALLRHFQNAKFKEAKTIQDFGHFFEYSYYLRDPKLGITINLEEDQTHVSSLHWNDPRVRTVAENKRARYRTVRDPATSLVTRIPIE